MMFFLCLVLAYVILFSGVFVKLYGFDISWTTATLPIFIVTLLGIITLIIKVI